MIRVFSKPLKAIKKKCSEKRVVTRPGIVISHVVVVIVLMKGPPLMMLVVHVVMMLTVALGLVVVLVVHRDCSVLLHRRKDELDQYELSTSFFNLNLQIRNFEKTLTVNKTLQTQ